MTICRAWGKGMFFSAFTLWTSEKDQEHPKSRPGRVSLPRKRHMEVLVTQCNASRAQKLARAAQHRSQLQLYLLNRFMDVSLLCQFATWTFRTFGHFDSKSFCYLPRCFTTCPKVCNLRYCKNFFVVRWRNVYGGSETSWYRSVQRCCRREAARCFQSVSSSIQQYNTSSAVFQLFRLHIDQCVYN